MKIAICGFGTVGSGVFEILTDNEQKDFEVVKIYNRHNEKKKKLLGKIYTDNINDVIDDSEIDIVIETIGGVDIAYDLVKKSLVNKKHVVSANKELVATHLDELSQIAKQNDVMFLFEASVGGGIPIINCLSQLIQYDNVEHIYGIINGTSNYILTKMHQQNCQLATALREAQLLGYAEANPIADLEGIDMVRKIAILAMISHNCSIDLSQVYHSGISNVSIEFINYIKSKDYVLKFVAEAIIADGIIDISVEPVLVENNVILANINDAYNAIFTFSKHKGTQMLNGLGAGKYATASSIINDLYCIYNSNSYLNYHCKSEYKVNAIDRIADYYVITDNNEIKLLKNVSRREITNYRFSARIM